MKYLNKTKTVVVLDELFKDSFWALLGNIFAKGLSIYSSVLLAKILGKEVFGEFSLIKNPLFASSMFFTFGFGFLVTKLISENINRGKDTLINIIKLTAKFTIVFSVIISVGLIFLSDIISIKYFGDFRFGKTIVLFSIWNILNSFNTLQLGIISGFRAFKNLISLSLISGVFLVFFTYYGSLFYSINGAVCALLIYQLINVVIYALLIRKLLSNVNERYLEAKKLVLFKDIFKEVLPIGFQEFVYSAFTVITSVIILKYSSKAEFGLYSAATQWSSIVLFIPGILRSVILAHFSLLKKGHEKRKIVRKVHILNFMAVIVPAIFVSLFSYEIELYYGGAYIGLSFLIMFAMLVSIQLSISNIYTQLYVSEQLNWQMFIIRLIKEIIFVSVMLVFFVWSDFNISDSIKIMISASVANFLMLFMSIGFYIKHIGN